MKTLFVSHNPHPVHLAFAKSTNAKIKITPFDKLIQLSKIYPIINYVYPTVISFLYSLAIDPQEEVLLVDGASSLYIAAFIKIRKPKMKIFYIDGDISMYSLSSQLIGKSIKKWAINKIDAVISVSEMNKKEISKYTTAPIRVCSPYPQNVVLKNLKRKNYALYVGRLDKDKNIMRIIDFSIQCPDIKKMIIVGHGAMESKIKNIAKKNNKIVFVGKVNNPSRYYNECKFLIHLPDKDPHPCTPMEAALSGCFPILSEGVGSRYLFDKVFIVKEPEDFQSINKRIASILKNEATIRSILKKNAKAIPSKKSSIAKFKKDFKELTRRWKRK